MRFKEVGISTARIRGLNEKPYWFEHRCFWAWRLTFEEASYLGFLNLSTIYLAEEKENAEAICMDFYGDEAIEFDIWKNGEYIKTISTKKYRQII